MAKSPAISRGPESITSRLLARYYPEGVALVPGASSHWQAFSREFKVKVTADGTLQDLAGYGFGESSQASLPARACWVAGNNLQLLMLDAPGLRQAIPAAKQTVRSMGLHFTQDAFRQTCTDWFLRRACAQPGMGPIRTILVIGDGPGILSALLHRRYPEARIILVDLGATLLFQANNVAKAFPDAEHVLAEAGRTPSRPANFTYCPADQLEALPEADVDLAINVASMQEMTHPTIAGYFTLLRARRTRLLYCCNRLQKRLPGGEVIDYMSYPWRAQDEHLVDEACPWHQWFVGRSAAPRVKLGGIPVPLLRRYDGTHWHRLTRLAHDA